MKAAIVFLIVGAVATGFAQDAPSPARQGSIRGKVTAADTGQPIANAAIRLTGGTFTTLKPHWEYTGADGTYEIADLPPGRYTVSASRVGYLRLDYGQQRPDERGADVIVSASSASDRIDFTLPHDGVITVRVLDERGEPAPGYSVRAYRQNPASGSRLVAAGEADPFLIRATDDRGEIRLWGLAPGEYYVGVEPGTLASVLTPSRRTQGQTFYPGTTADTALPVTVGLGQEVFVEIPLVSVRAARISGVIVGQAPLTSPPRVSLTRRLVGSSGGGPPIAVRPDGSFSASGLGPAEYDISARTENEGGTLRVQVSGQDLDGLVLTMKPAVTLRGRLTFDSRAPIRSASPSTLRILPTFTEGIAFVSSSTINADWSFEIGGVTGVGVLRPPQLTGWFLKAVVIEGKDVTDVPVDLASIGARPIEVQLTQRLSQVSGSVLDAANRPTMGYSVVVFPADSTQWTSYSRFIATARPDQNGRFLITGLPPGNYFVRAVELLRSGAERNPDTLERLRSGATALMLKDQESASVTLRLAP